ncbi:MAG: helix-turn-helix transcriptional regulator [Acidimicrobiales bacterium]
MTRSTASERVRRLLALVPWVSTHSPVAIDEVCSRFGIDRATLIAELSVLPFVGVPPYTPDTLIDVDFDDDQIIVRLSEPFDRPLRLTSEQALTLIAAGRSIREVPGADSDDPLQRGLAKLATALGVDPDQVHVELGEAHSQLLDDLLAAATDGRRVEIDYYTYSRDQRSVRAVDPYQVVADRGNWYLIGWCHRSAGVRVFRVDRMASLTVLDDPIDPPPEDVEWDRYQPGTTEPRVVLDLDPAAQWILDQYPYDEAHETTGGTVRTTLAVSGRSWLERLLLTLGPAARVVDGPDDLVGAGQDAARRVLARYGEG